MNGKVFITDLLTASDVVVCVQVIFLEVVIIYNWDLQIIETEETGITFTASNDDGCSFTIDAMDIGSGTHRIINLILTDCPSATIYVTDLTGNQDLIESILEIRKVSYMLN